MMSEQRQLFGFEEVGARWGVSPWTVRRAVDRGEIKAINIGARRLISLGEIQRVELTGIGHRKKTMNANSK
jgi:hypothetical protein